MDVHHLRKQFLRIIEGSRDVVGLYGEDGRCLYVNHPGFYADDADFRGDPFERIDAQDRERIRAEYGEIIRSGEGRRLEFRATTPDGSLRLLQSETNPVRDPSGKVLAVLCIARNVTEERRGEAALKTALETLFQQAPVGIGITDMDGKVVRVNARMETLLGHPAEELLKFEVWDVTHPDDRPLYKDLFADLASGRLERFAFEKRVVRSGGEVRWIACSSAVVRPPLGAERFTVEMAEDITERKHIQEALAEREELLELIFQHAPIGIAITDRDARFVRVNPCFERMLGYTQAELTRLTGWDIIYPEDVRDNQRLRDELWSGRRKSFTWERSYVRKGGEVLWVHNTVSLIRDIDEAPLYALALVEDISERKLADAAIHSTAGKLQALTRRLVDLQESERRDIARELHDRVGQTLTAMRINMDMIRERLRERDDAVIRGRNDDSLELIDAAFEAVENVMYELRPPMIDEHGLIAPLKWHAKRFTERTGIHVDVRGSEASRLDPDVELALFRVAQEALNNVARHSRARNVVIELAVSGAQVVFSIEDDGVGFEEPGEAAGRPGYGLITMSERAEGVGGTFAASSTPGRGARLTVTVPLRP